MFARIKQMAPLALLWVVTSLLGVSAVFAEPYQNAIEVVKVQAWNEAPVFVPYAEAYRYFEAYEECPHMKPRFRIEESERVDIGKLRIKLVGDNIDVDVAVNLTDRTVAIPHYPQAMKLGAELRINTSKALNTVRVDAVAQFPAGSLLRYRDLMSAVDEANRCEKKVMPKMMRFMRKSYRGFRLRFDGPATVTINSVPKQILSTNEEHIIWMSLDPLLMKQNPQIYWSETPHFIEPSHIKLGKDTRPKNN